MMTLTEEIEHLWGLALSKDAKGKWRYSDFPVAKDSSARLATRWPIAKKKKTFEKQDPITLELVERFFVAEARARREIRQQGGKPPTPVGISVWLNEARWDNGVLTEDETKRDKRFCHCGKETHGPELDECTHHLAFTAEGKMKGRMSEELRDYARKNPEVLSFKRDEAVKYMKKCIAKLIR